jgi:hypothetical protein
VYESNPFLSTLRVPSPFLSTLPSRCWMNENVTHHFYLSKQHVVNPMNFLGPLEASTLSQTMPSFTN